MQRERSQVEASTTGFATEKAITNEQAPEGVTNMEESIVLGAAQAVGKVFETFPGQSMNDQDTPRQEGIAFL